MPYLVRENLSISNIADAADILQNGTVSITHILSVLSSASISFFSDWRNGLTIPSKEIKKLYAGDAADGGAKTALSPEKLLYSLEYAGNDLKIVRMAVPIRDTENEDLLDYLEVCIDFIDRSRKEGSVLVHCFAGVSRSAAVITAYLMRTEHLSLEDALESLRQSCEFVCPNDGFLEQLKLFEEMGFKVDYTTPIYRRFRLKILAFRIPTDFLIPHPELVLEGLHFDLKLKAFSFSVRKRGNLQMWQEAWIAYGKAPLVKEVIKQIRKGKRRLRDHFSVSGIDSSKLGADPGMPVQISSDVEEATKVENKHRLTYRCKKCRRVVALQENVVGHTPGEGETSFEYKRRSGNPFDNSNESECSSVFIEPLRWMKAVEEGALEGKLSCTQCDARLGYFNWTGIQCSCGSWITPAFQLHKGRVDISRV
ncbi:hypothetical protein Lal_00000930 [Lupinus albus]|nr:hypothetical protein Lal_00000930 [Lupinus albus]